jgi:hypothetical protein
MWDKWRSPSVGRVKKSQSLLLSMSSESDTMPKIAHPNTKYSSVTVPFPREQRDRLVALANREQRGVSNLIRLIVTDYLEKAC